MNFIGKIFVVLILIMSIVFMTVAAVVYATHRNWEDLAKKRTQERDQVRQQLTALTTQYNDLQTKIETQQDVARQQIAKLQTEQGLLVARNTGIQQELDQLKETRRQAVAAVASTQENNNRLADENNGLRDEVRETQRKTDVAFAQSLAATEKVNATVGELEAALARTQTLTEDVGRMRTVLESAGIDPATSADSVTPNVNGFVSAVRRNGSLRLIEITIGADDGLRIGHTIEVFRGRKYLGRATIRKTAPDQAVAELDPRFLEGRIQEGDRVATRLKLS